MDKAGWLARLRADGELFAIAVETAGPDAAVPTCGDWRMRDLVLHQGRVHRWAARHVADRLTERGEVPAADVADADLAGWLRTGCAELADLLAAAPDDLACWTFLPAASPVLFWCRRQAHETAIHRADAELAAGAPVSGVAPPFAADGADEFLRGFLGRFGPRLLTDRRAGRLAVRPADTPDRWLVEHSGAEVRISAGDGTADCAVAGPAGELYLALWRRRPLDGLPVEGDAALLRDWWAAFRI